MCQPTSQPDRQKNIYLSFPCFFFLLRLRLSCFSYNRISQDPDTDGIRVYIFRSHSHSHFIKKKKKNPKTPYNLVPSSHTEDEMGIDKYALLSRVQTKKEKKKEREIYISSTAQLGCKTKVIECPSA